ncbi:MAG: hypothetical protein CVV21_01950 [Candidatus Goldiibacteriota bacterium HGW-Goldbacteria-1]|jgi:fibronectin type 3 domain-containing protein|nr:MAG: hypothetical protein CVV21_01950 [Candidatus Goldiibacteriota bacterium HGW-Goldbacteria-1]
MKKLFLTALLMLLSGFAMAAPYAVTGLSVYNCGGIKLVWDAPSDTSTAVSYVINRSVISAGPFDLTVTASVNNYYDASADTTLAYYYTVKSVDFTGATGAASAAKSTLPASPENLQAVPYNAKNMLSWQPSSDGAVESYNIYRSSGYGFKILNNTYSTEYTDESAANGTLYWYRVASLKTNQEGACACSASAKPYIPPFPVSAVDAFVEAGELTAAWTMSALQGTYEIDSFKIFRSTSYGDESFSPASVTYTSYSETLPLAGQLYYYAVRTIDTQGNSSPAYWFSAYNPGLPSVPLGLTVTAANAARINISWQANPAAEDITAYQVIRNSAIIATKATPTAASYEDMDVVLGNTYSYYIQAINSFGTGDGSSAVTQTVIPAPPAGLTATTGVLPGTVYLNWADNNAEENIQTYNIYRATSAVTFNYTTPYLSTGTAGVTDAAVVTGTPYFYSVSAVTETAYESFSEIVSAMAVTYAAQPENLTATAYSNYAELSWDNPGASYAIASFKIYKSTDGSVFNYLASVSPPQFNDAGLTNGSTYYYRVSAVNIYGESTHSEHVTITPQAGYFTEPKNLTATAEAGDGRIILSWSAVQSQEITGYKIYRSTVSGSYDTVPYATAVTITAYTDSAAATLTTYYYKVSGYGVSETAKSAEVSAAPFIRPGPALNLTLTSLYDRVYLTWDSPANDYTYKTTVKYNIYRSTSSLSYSQSAFTALASEYTGASYIDAQINTAGTYYYKIKVIDDMGNEDTSTTGVQIVLSGVMEPPAVLKGVASNKQVRLVWSSINPDSYSVYRKTTQTAAEFGAPIAYNLGFDVKEYVDSNVENNITYIYAVAAVNDSGEGPKSNPVYVTPYLASGLPADASVKFEIENKKDVRLWWNPASDGTYQVAGYSVFRSNDNGYSYVHLSVTAASVVEYTDTATEWDNNYLYMVRVVDSGGNTDATYTPVKVELPLPKNKIRVFSNLVDLSKGEKLRLKYLLVKSGKLKFYITTLSGVHVRTLIESTSEQGITKNLPFESGDIFWDGTNQSGKKVASGAYLIVLEMDGVRVIEKAAVVK